MAGIDKGNPQEYKVARQWKDIIQKYVSALYKDSVLEFYGIKTAKVKELISANLPEVDVRDSGTDQVLLLENDTYLHLGFETGYHKKVLIRHLEYDVRLYARDGREIKTVIVYTSDVKEIPPPLRIGPDITYSPSAVLLVKYDGDAIIAKIEAKVKAKEQLSNQDIIELTFLPFMKTVIPRSEMAYKVVTLAKSIPDGEKQEACLATTIAYASKMLSKADIKRLLEVIRMTNLAIAIDEVFGEEAREQERQKWEKIVAEKDAIVAEKDAIVAKKDAIVAKKDAELAKLRAQLKAQKRL